MGWENDPIVAAAEKAPWENDPVVERRKTPRASGIYEAAKAGYQGSYTGLANRGKMPDIELDPEHSKWYERLAAGATQLAAETPAMIAGAIGGAAAGSAVGPVGTILGGGAGAFAVPTAIRQALIEAYSKGEVVSSADFLTRVGITIKETAKSAVVGAATMGAGAAAARLTGKVVAPMIGEKLTVGTARNVIGTAGLTAEIGTMTVAPAALEGRMPEPRDFIDAAILVGGLKASTKIASKIARVYEKTGIPPEQVAADARVDPKIAEELRAAPAKADAADVKIVDALKMQVTPTVASAQKALADIEALSEKYKDDRMYRVYFSEGSGKDIDRGMARVAEERWAELTPATQEFLGPRFAKDWETGESIQAVDSVRGTHIFDLRTLAESNQADLFDIPSASKAAKIYEKTGIPPGVKVYHGTNGPIDGVLDINRAGQTSGIKNEPAIWFTSDANSAKGFAEMTVANRGGEVVAHEFSLNPKNPLTIDVSIEDITSGRFGQMKVDGIAKAKADGNDVVIFKPPRGGMLEVADEIAVLDPAAIRKVADTKTVPADDIPSAYKPMAVETTVRDVLRGDGHDMKIADVLANPQGKITAGKEPNHINYEFANGPEEVLAVRARIAEVFEQQLNEARGKESWDQTAGRAREIMENQGLKPDGGDFNALAAKAMAWEAMSERAAFDFAEAAREVRSKGAAATEADFAKQAAALENLAFLHAVDQANGAEIARALNARKAARERRGLASGAAELFTQYGNDPKKIAQIVGEMENAQQIAQFAKKAVAPPTMMDKYVEAIKAGLISGPITQLKNALGNFAFLASRPVIDAVAATGGKVHFTEPVARVVGNFAGFAEALHIANAFYKARMPSFMEAVKVPGEAGRKLMGVLRELDQGGGKQEDRRAAISGDKGVAIRTFFTALRVVDGLFQTMIQRGELNTLAARQAAKEGFNPLSQEFRTRMVELAQNPDAKMIEAAEQAALRFTFNAELGKPGQKVQELLNAVPFLKLEIPFVRTPGNVFKEMFRMTPFAPFIDTWKADWNKGGADRHKAIAEVVVGMTTASAIMSLAMQNDWITGSLDPDPAKRNTQISAGMQQYSVKINGTYYDYSWIQPIGTLVGLAVDVAKAWHMMGTEEKDKVGRALSIGFANSVTNQTFLQGATNVIRLFSEPDRYGEKFLQAYAAMHVPSILAQNAQLADPYVREIQSVMDAVKNRLPGARQTLYPTRDAFGEPRENPDRVLGVSPVKAKELSEDPVRLEAARLKIGVEKAPKSIQLPAGGDRQLGKVELTPEQRDIFGEKSGQLAHEILTRIVDSPSWEGRADMDKRAIYNKVFEKARAVARAQVLTPDQRRAEVDRIVNEIRQRRGQ